MVELFAVVMIALMVSGFVYAMWSDTLTIKGTVKTGTFDVDLSLHNVFEPEGHADVIAELSGDNKTLTITVENAYPHYYFVVVFDIHNAGSIPAKLTNFEISGNITYADGTKVELTDIPAWIEGNWSLWYPFTDPHGTPDNTGTDLCKLFTLLENYQLNGGEAFLIAVQFNILGVEGQIEPPQGATIEFELTFDAVQWNGYVSP